MNEDRLMIIKKLKLNLSTTLDYARWSHVIAKRININILAEFDLDWLVWSVVCAIAVVPVFNLIYFAQKISISEARVRVSNQSVLAGWSCQTSQLFIINRSL